MRLKAYWRLLKLELNLVELVFSSWFVDWICSRLKTKWAQFVLTRLERVVEELMGIVSKILNLIIDHKVKIEDFEWLLDFLLIGSQHRTEHLNLSCPFFRLDVFFLCNFSLSRIELADGFVIYLKIQGTNAGFEASYSSGPRRCVGNCIGIYVRVVSCGSIGGCRVSSGGISCGISGDGVWGCCVGSGCIRGSCNLSGSIRRSWIRRSDAVSGNSIRW